VTNGDAPARGFRPWRAAALATIALVTLAMGERLVPWLRNRGPDASGRAQWIWSEDNPFSKSPAAFFAVRDFDLAVVPPHARLLISADEEYIAYLDGVRLGSNRWLPGAPLDAYDVAPLLRVGRNRLAVELRSANGIGGCVVRLERAPGEEDILGTGRSWRIVRTASAETLTHGVWPQGDPPILWGHSPIGRWDSPRAVSRPLFGRTVAGAEALPPRSYRALDRTDRWWPWPRWGRRGNRTPQAVLDWGEEVTGYLNLRFRDAGPRVGLLWFGATPPEPRREAVADAVVVTVPGRGSWHDAVPRRFRYVALVGLRGLAGVQVQTLAPGQLDPFQPAPLAGVFGLTPTPLRAPVEDEIWRQLEGGASGAVGQGD
jgi:hypothetical protein